MSWTHHRSITRHRATSTPKPVTPPAAPAARPPRIATTLNAAASSRSPPSTSTASQSFAVRSVLTSPSSQLPPRAPAGLNAVQRLNGHNSPASASSSASSTLLRQLSPAVWVRILAFLAPQSGITSTGLARTCRLICTIAHVPQQRRNQQDAARSSVASPPRPLHTSHTFSTPPRIHPPDRGAVAAPPPIPSASKLQRSLILQAASAGEPVDAVISEPWWQLEQSTVDTMRHTLINLITPPRSPRWSSGSSPRPSSVLPLSPTSLPLSPREVDRWHTLMRHVDKGYVKQLRRRRLRDKQRMGVRGEEVDDIARLEQSMSSTNISTERLDDSPTLTSLASPSSSSSSSSYPLPSHCFAVPPVPFFLPESSMSTISFWRDQVLPRWSEMNKHVLTLRLWSKDGIPAACRRDVWRTRLGNEKAVTEAVFRRHWRGNDVTDDGKEETKEDDDENGVASAAAVVSTPNGRPRANTSPRGVTSPSSTSAPSSASSPATPLPDTIHAFSLPAIALLAAESSLSSQLTQLQDELLPAPSDRDHIHNDLVRMFDEQHLDDIDSVDEQRQAADLPPLMSTLHAVLATFAAYAPESSYVQGMNYMLCLLLLYMTPYEAFVALNSLLTHDWYAAYVSMNVTAMQTRCQLLSTVLRHNLPQLASHLVQLPPDCYFIEWMLTFYVSLLSFTFTSRLMDAYLLQGEEVIYRVAIAVLWWGERRLLAMDLGECSQWLRGGMKEEGEGVNEDEVWRLMAKVVVPPVSQSFFSKSKKAANR